MDLKYKKSQSEPHSGWGAGPGTIDREVYECPCGQGEVVYEKDNIPGFRDKSVYCDCKDCNEGYYFSRGTATIK